MLSTVWNYRNITRISINIFYFLVFVLGVRQAAITVVLRMLPISLHEFFIVTCNFARFHTFIIVSNYSDNCRKMNYNMNLHSTICTIGTIGLIRVYELI